MLRFLVSFILCLCLNICISQKIEISKNWKFSKEDNPIFSSKNYDDNNWNKITLNSTWEDFLKKSFDGIAWYRLKFIIPKSMESILKQKGSAIINLGKIDDADECFFNGKKIGSTGTFPPESQTAWDTDRAYTIPFNLIKFDTGNVIAVRVADWGGGGGLYKADEYSFEVSGWSKQSNLDIDIHPPYYFDENTYVDIPIVLTTKSNDNISGNFKITLQDVFNNVIIKNEKRFIPNLIQKQAFATFVTPQLNAGFYEINVIFEDLNGINIKNKIGFAVAPNKLTNKNNRPLDFDKFWNDAKLELATIKPNYKIIPKPELDTKDFKTSLVEMQSLENKKIRGWLMVPKTKNIAPAILHVQGYSTTYTAQGGDTNFVHFYLNIRGHGNSKDDVNPGFPGFLISGVDKKETYIYRGAFMDCIRAMDFLYSQSAIIDTSLIGVAGGSQGGALTFVTASLDKRVKCAFADIPFLSDYENYFKYVKWPGNEFKDYLKKNKKEMPELISVLNYFDIKYFAQNINIPFAISSALLDDVCPPYINFAAYNNINIKNKRFYLYPASGHSLPSSHYNIVNNFFKTQLVF